MSNTSLAHRLTRLCDDYEQGKVAAKDMKVTVELCAESFEALEFTDYKSLREIATDQETESWFADDGCGNTAMSRKLLGELRAIALRLALPASPAPAPNPPKD